MKSIGLEMSTDDGANWHKIPVHRTGSGWTAVLPNPRAAGFVSLRAVVTDTAGSGLTQTITRAYAVGPPTADQVPLTRGGASGERREGPGRGRRETSGQGR